jgi:DNA (cytosine-5)-methyltransferase 1
MIVKTSAPAYYNENDPRAAAWLRELIKGDHIARGDVDERSIADVTPADLAGYTQCHFFAGIGGWSYALRLAGWDDSRHVWTGSCPCQPFSQAGRGKGLADERHLFPAWFHLISQCKPAVIFGEQVASPAGLGWLDLVQAYLEDADYAVGAADLCAAGVGAPHIRQRLYWVAESGRERLEGVGLRLRERRSQPDFLKAWRHSEAIIKVQRMGHANHTGSQGRSERRDGPGERSPWEASLVDCRDGKRRPVEPGTFPLAHGIPGRVGLLRGYGNAIVPQVAAAFIKAYEETLAAHEGPA